jgi:lysyl-tRNA synthetase class 2
MVKHTGAEIRMPWEPNKLERERLDKLDALRAQGIEPFPGQVNRTHTLAEAAAQFTAQEATTGEAPQPLRVAVCGRLRSIRTGGKVSFADIEDGTGRLQLFLRIDRLGEAQYDVFRRQIDLFDFVSAGGEMMRTRAGEISVQVDQLSVLAKAISPLPVVKAQEVDGQAVQYGGLTDVEERFRQRYADLASNADVREVFRVRARTINAARRFLDGEGFLEVETPILQPIYGGAAARPFVTHHNQLHQDLYLRISFELYLKRLLVGGYDAVYEIGRDFRNEGVSFKHNPEFTQIEFYKAYIDYHGVMDITERMVAFVAEQVTGSAAVSYQGSAIHYAPPWTRITLREAIKQHVEIDYMEHPDAESLYAAIKAIEPDFKPGLTWGKMVDHLLGKYVEPGLIQPTFVLDYPRDISPFAKRVDYDDFHTERFEFFVAGMEMGNAFTELNDPRDQEQRFIEMQALYGDEDDEATPLDEDYLRAMRYGMPPCGGFGMGVDRLVMLMTDQRSIRDVLLYPHLRDEK